jgi:hypothetical protein
MNTNAMRVLIFLFATSSLFAGCAAPGSAAGKVGVIVRYDQEIEAPKEIRVILPKEYGLAGLDRVWGRPESYGHRNIERTSMLKEGCYRVEFPPVTYSISFWLLPPLGAFPKQPPTPFYYLQFSGTEDEVYFVSFGKKGLHYRVYDRNSGVEKKQSDAAWIFTDGRYFAETEKDRFETWFIEFALKPNLLNALPKIGCNAPKTQEMLYGKTGILRNSPWLRNSSK